jgi:hypothetical protein
MLDEATIADRIDEVLTIYRSALSHKPIGYQIKGVAALASKFGWEGVMSECEEGREELKSVSLSALLLAAYEQGPKTIGRRKAYADAFDSVGSNPRMRLDDIPTLFPS